MKTKLKFFFYRMLDISADVVCTYDPVCHDRDLKRFGVRQHNIHNLLFRMFLDSDCDVFKVCDVSATLGGKNIYKTRVVLCMHWNSHRVVIYPKHTEGAQFLTLLSEKMPDRFIYHTCI